MYFNKELSLDFLLFFYYKGCLGQLDGKLLIQTYVQSHRRFCFKCIALFWVNREISYYLFSHMWPSPPQHQDYWRAKCDGRVLAVASQYSGGYFCSGTLINKEWVLSASDCFIAYGGPTFKYFLWISSAQVSYSLYLWIHISVIKSVLYLQHPRIWHCGLLGTSDPKWLKPTWDKQDSD